MPPVVLLRALVSGLSLLPRAPRLRTRLSFGLTAPMLVPAMRALPRGEGLPLHEEGPSTDDVRGRQRREACIRLRHHAVLPT